MQRRIDLTQRVNWLMCSVEDTKAVAKWTAATSGCQRAQGHEQGAFHPRAGR